MQKLLPRIRQRYRCQSDQCCRVLLWTKQFDPVLEQERHLLVPLKDINIAGTIEAGHAHVMTYLVYSNTGHENPVECTFEFPIEANTVITKLAARIDNILVQARIKYKEPGLDDDSLQSSNVAYRPTQNVGESIILHLGTLLPGQNVRIDLQMVMPLSVNQGAYEFALPMSFLPKYWAHEVFIDPRQNEPHFSDLVPEYTCKYSFLIVDQSVTWISVPNDAKTSKLDIGYEVQSVSNGAKRAIRIQYKSNLMQEPQLKCQIDEPNGEVACMVSFVPTFEPIQLLQEPVLTNDEPIATELSSGSNFCFVFLIDRGESMQGRPMEIAKKALLLLIKSLPAGSHFAISSFGPKLDFLFREAKTDKDVNTYEKAFNNLSVEDQPWRELLQQLGQQGFLDIKRNIDVCKQSQGQMSVMHDLLFQNVGENQLAECANIEQPNPVWTLDGDHIEIVSQQISKFAAASAGNSTILQPLKEAVKLNVGTRKKIIFLLTNSSNLTRSVPFPKESRHLARIHTFVIGKHCDEALLKHTAIAGRGAFTLLEDDSNDLTQKVKSALRRSFEPSLSNCVLKWPTQTIQLNELFRFEPVNCYIILTIKEFNALQVTFQSDGEPIGQQPVHRQYLTESFQRSELPLFQLAAHDLLKELYGKANKRCSVKYQVLSKETAFFGQVKQKNFTTGEITRYKVPMARIVPNAANQHVEIAPSAEDQKMRIKLNQRSRSDNKEGVTEQMWKTGSNGREERTNCKLSSQLVVPAPPITPIQPRSEPDSYSVPTQAVLQPYPEPLLKAKPTMVEARITKKRSNLESVGNCKQSLMSSLDYLLQQSKANLCVSQMQMFIEEQSRLKIKRMKLKTLDVKEKQSESKLTLQHLISLSSAQGYWPPESRAQVQQFFTKQLPLQVDTTLAALCVLLIMFDDREDEWQMTAQKAREYLKTNGVNVQQDLAKIVHFVKFK